MKTLTFSCFKKNLLAFKENFRGGGLGVEVYFQD